MSSDLARLPFKALDWYTAGQCTADDIARRAGVSRRTVIRWKRAGVPLTAADRVAVGFGEHPALIWTNWYGLA